MKGARLVAKHELLDLFRNRQVWISLLTQPIIFFAMIIFIGWIGQQQTAGFQTKRFTATINGTDRDTAPFVHLLRTHGFIIRRNTDVFGSLQRPKGASQVVLDVPAHTVDRIAEGTPAHIHLYFTKTDNKSQTALLRAQSVLASYATTVVGQRLAVRGVDERLTQPFVIATTDFTSTAKGVRLSLATLIPGFVLLQSMALVGTAASRLSGRKDKRTLEPLLLLPLRRIDVLRGAGVAAFIMGLIPVVSFIIPVSFATLLPFAFKGNLSSTAAVAIGLIVVGPLIAALMVTVGLLIGTIGRGAESGSALTSLGFMPFAALGFLFAFIPTLPSSTPMYAIPGYGAALLMRSTIGHGFPPVPFLIVLASTVVTATLVLRVAAQYLDTERGVLRPSG